MSNDKNKQKQDQSNRSTGIGKKESGRVILNEDRRPATISESMPAPSRRPTGQTPQPSKKGNDGS